MTRSIAMHLFLVPTFLALSGCATFAPPPRVEEEPRTIAHETRPGSVNVALVLSGGGFRGFAHVGVIRVLEEHGIRPDLIIGSSAGALFGALYASGLDAGQVEEVARRMDFSLFRDFVLPGLVFTPGELGFIRGEKLLRFIEGNIPRRHMQDFPLRFGAVVTDLKSGAPRTFNAGSAAKAVVASSAIPGVLMPAYIEGGLYGDGQIASPVPVASAREMGASIVIAVDVVYPPQEAFLSSAIGVLFQAFAISSRRLADQELAAADVVIAPDIPPTTGQYTFSSRDMLIRAGERAAREALPRIRQALGSRGNATTGIRDSP